MKRSVRMLVLVLGLDLVTAVVGCATARPSGNRPTVGAGAASMESEMDLEITRQIHLAVRSDPSLSTAARRVTVVTLGAVVTLRGSVGSSRESEAIARHAREVSGVQRIENALSVRTSPRD
jgi:osmotically-inducible protein OsmY